MLGCWERCRSLNALILTKTRVNATTDAKAVLVPLLNAVCVVVEISRASRPSDEFDRARRRRRLKSALHSERNTHTLPAHTHLSLLFLFRNHIDIDCAPNELSWLLSQDFCAFFSTQRTASRVKLAQLCRVSFAESFAWIDLVLLAVPFVSILNLNS